MAFTYDPSTNSGKVRLLCTDTDQAYAIFDDAEIDTFLAIEGGDVRLAAAMALETIASSTALIDKKIKSGDLQTDGPAVARELRERAQRLRDQVSDGDYGFDIAEQALNHRNTLEILTNSALRSGL